MAGDRSGAEIFSGEPISRRGLAKKTLRGILAFLGLSVVGNGIFGKIVRDRPENTQVAVEGETKLNNSIFDTFFSKPEKEVTAEEVSVAMSEILRRLEAVYPFSEIYLRISTHHKEENASLLEIDKSEATGPTRVKVYPALSEVDTHLMDAATMFSSEPFHSLYDDAGTAVIGSCSSALEDSLFSGENSQLSSSVEQLLTGILQDPSTGNLQIYVEITNTQSISDSIPILPVAQERWQGWMDTFGLLDLVPKIWETELKERLLRVPAMESATTTVALGLGLLRGNKSFKVDEPVVSVISRFISQSSGDQSSVELRSDPDNDANGAAAQIIMTDPSGITKGYYAELLEFKEHPELAHVLRTLMLTSIASFFNMVWGK